MILNTSQYFVTFQTAIYIFIHFIHLYSFKNIFHSRNKSVCSSPFLYLKIFFHKKYDQRDYFALKEKKKETETINTLNEILSFIFLVLE